LKNKRNNRIIRYFFKVFAYFIIGIIVLYLAIEVNFLWLFGNLPEVDRNKKINLSYSSKLYSADSVLLGKFYIEEREPIYTLNEVNPLFIKALLATEDVRFFEHKGIDLEATFSILWYIIKGENRGGSTITQQLVKNLYKTRANKNTGLLGHIPFLRPFIIKFKEWITAIKMEKIYSKNEILTMYLNTISFGNNAYGIRIGAKRYFNTIPSKLTLNQSAILVGMLKATSYYNPILYPQRVKNRRNVVLSQMLKYNFITKEEYNNAINSDLNINFTVEDQENIPVGGYFRNAVATYLKEHGYNVYTDGLIIYSTLNYKMQLHAENTIKEYMKKLQKKFNRHWGKKNPWVNDNEEEIPNYINNIITKTQMYKQLQQTYKNQYAIINKYINTPKKTSVFSYNGIKDTFISPFDSVAYFRRFLQTGFVSINPYNGHILTWVGGINYKFFKYDNVKQSKRQPGSTFKPFVYTTAIDSFNYSPCDKLVDKPITINYIENGEKKSWSPHNADWENTNREMTFREALAKSINSIAAQLTEIVTPEAIIIYAKRMGIKSKLKPVPSIGLGSNEVSLLEMVASYCTFLNDGYYIDPLPVKTIYDNNRKLLKKFYPVKKRAISPETAFLMTYMLKGGIEIEGGTSQALFEFDLFKNGNEIGGKTGTSSDYSDAWFIGLTKDIVAGVWVGGIERCIRFRKSERAEGALIALPIFGQFMEKIYKDKSINIKPGPFPKPSIEIKKEYKCKHASHKEEEDYEEDYEEENLEQEIEKDTI